MNSTKICKKTIYSCRYKSLCFLCCLLNVKSKQRLKLSLKKTLPGGLSDRQTLDNLVEDGVLVVGQRDEEQRLRILSVDLQLRDQILEKILGRIGQNVGRKQEKQILQIVARRFPENSCRLLTIKESL